MKLTQKLTITATLLALFSWSCSSADNPVGAGSNVVDISIENNLFSPSSRTVPVGTTVRWTNEDAVQMQNDFHTVDSGKPMNATTLTPPLNLTFTQIDDVRQYTFNTAGTFSYFCSRHGETGQIIVQ